MSGCAVILLVVKRDHGAMHVAKIERRHGDRVYTYWLVRRSVREGKRVRHETVANVSKLPAAALEALLAKVPLRRFGTPEEIAHACAYLISDYAGYVTGEVLVADGGAWLEKGMFGS